MKSITKFYVTIFFSLITMAPTTSGGVIYVPGQQPTIQAAINASDPGGTVMITLPGVYNENLLIDKSLVIRGDKTFKTVIDGQKKGRVITISQGSVYLRDLTIINGETEGNGGGILSLGDLYLDHCVIRANRCWPTSLGGGVYHTTGRLTLNNSILHGNSADTGGGIAVKGGKLVVSSSIFFLNSAAHPGGGIIMVGGWLWINSSRIDHNTADGGAGICLIGHPCAVMYNSSIVRNVSAANAGAGINNNGALKLVNCTLSGNTVLTVNGGGAIANSGSIDALHCTIAYNQGLSAGPGGVANIAEFVAKDCIIARNDGGVSLPNPLSVPQDFQGNLKSSGFNLIQSTAGAVIYGTLAGNIYGLDPLLGPLQDNGGPSMLLPHPPTHALLPGSPAIDAGQLSVAFDQRGFPRPYDFPLIPNAADGVDLGAVEMQP